jgi:pre-mRNA-splicing factor 18
MRKEQEHEREQEKERLRKEKLYGKTRLPPTATSTTTTTTTTTREEGGETFNVSNEEAIRRLRRIGQPIRLFAETDKERRLRLRALELIEERTEGQRNDFARAMEGQELGLEREKEKNKNGGARGQANKKHDKDKKPSTVTTKLDGDADRDEAGIEREPKPKDEEVLVNLDLVKTNPHKVYPQIYHALKVGISLSRAR